MLVGSSAAHVSTGTDFVFDYVVALSASQLACAAEVFR